MDESRQARSRELAAEALKVIDTQPDLATMLAVEAADNAWTTEAISAVRRSVMQPHLTGTVHRRNQPIARSPDNRWIVYRKSKGSILVVERGSGRAGRTLDVPRADVRSTTFSPDEAQLAMAFRDGSVRMWRLDDFHHTDIQVGSLTAFGFDPAGTALRVVVGAEVRVIDVATGADRIAPITLPPFVTFAWGGARLALQLQPDSATADSGSVVVFDLDTGARLFDFEHGGPVVSVDVSADGATALTLGVDLVVRFWDLGSGAGRATVIRVPGPFPGLSPRAWFGPASLVETETDRLRVWDRNTGRQLGELERALTDVGALDVSWASYPFVAAQYWFVRSTSYIADVSTNRVVVDLSTLEGNPSRPRLDFDGSYEFEESLPSGAERAWGGRTESTVALPRTDIVAASFSGGGRRVALLASNGSVEVRDIEAPGDKVVFRAPAVAGSNAVALSPDARTLVTSGRAVRVWDVDRGTVKVVAGTSGQVVAFSGDSRRFAVRSFEGARVYGSRTGEPIGSIIRLKSLIATGAQPRLVLDHDGRRAFVGDDSATAFRADVATGRPVGRPFTGHVGSINAVAISRDDTLGATGGLDKVAIVWNLNSGRRVTTLRGARTAVEEIAFSGDGDLVAVRSRDGNLRVYETNSGQLVLTYQLSASDEVGLVFDGLATSMLHAETQAVTRIPCPACAPRGAVVVDARSNIHREFTPQERRQYRIDD